MDVIDIACPRCASTDAIGKIALGRYRCERCGRTFTAAEVVSATKGSQDSRSGTTHSNE